MNSTSFLLGVTILGTSFWGSWHCAAMCGPIASLMASRKTVWPYHLGRGLSYVLIGALSGAIGSFFLENQFYWLRLASGIFFALVMIVMGFMTFKGVAKPFAFQAKWLHRYFTKQSPGFSLGLLTVFLPCGWLYSYVIAAASTRSPWAGSLLMFLFWLGGLPAMSAISLYMKKAVQLAPARKQKIAGLVLAAAGVYSIFSFYFLHGLHF